MRTNKNPSTQHCCESVVSLALFIVIIWIAIQTNLELVILHYIYEGGAGSNPRPTGWEMGSVLLGQCPVINSVFCNKNTLNWWGPLSPVAQISLVNN